MLCDGVHNQRIVIDIIRKFSEKCLPLMFGVIQRMVSLHQKWCRLEWGYEWIKFLCNSAHMYVTSSVVLLDTSIGRVLI